MDCLVSSHRSRSILHLNVLLSTSDISLLFMELASIRKLYVHVLHVVFCLLLKNQSANNDRCDKLSVCVSNAMYDVYPSVQDCICSCFKLHVDIAVFSSCALSFCLVCQFASGVFQIYKTYTINLF